MYALGVLLAAAMIGALIMLAVEVRQWTSGRLFISRRRFVLRMLVGFTLLVLLAGIFAGLLILRLAQPGGRPLLFLGYWLGCLAAAFALVFLALAEMREVRLRGRERENEIWKDIARLIAGKNKKKD
jgi:hypothetical protein